MKMTNLVMVNLMNTLQAYSTKKLPQKISFAITRNLIKISKEYEIYDTQLKKLFETYSDHIIKDEDGNDKTNTNGIPIVDDSVKTEFNEQIKDLLNIEIDIEMYLVDPEIFNYDDKEGIYNAMSAQDIIVLQSVLCDMNKE